MLILHPFASNTSRDVSGQDVCVHVGDGQEVAKPAILYRVLGGAAYTSKILQARVGTGRYLIAVYTISCSFSGDSMGQRNTEPGRRMCYLSGMELC